MIKVTVTDEGIPMVWNSEDWIKLRNEYRILGNLCGSLPDVSSQEQFHGLPLVLLPYEATLLREKKIARLVRYPSLARAPGKGVREEYEKYCQRICDGQLTTLVKKQRQSDINERSKDVEETEENSELLKVTKRTRKRRKDSGDSSHSSLLNLAIEKFGEEELKRIILSNSLWECKHPYPWLRKEDACSVKWRYPSTSAENLTFNVFKDFWEKGYYISSGHKFGAHFIVYPGDPFVYSAHFLVICIERNAAIRPSDVAVLCRLGDTMNKSVVLACETNDKITYQTLKCSVLSK
ncbi:tRNA-splicing endonuclease subunit Sen34 [Gryllus bimaculatus]|nr:tRNA-splicing endonuclease subunit Sen34 [Gryllus bimaculatus]